MLFPSDVYSDIENIYGSPNDSSIDTTQSMIPAKHVTSRLPAEVVYISETAALLCMLLATSLDLLRAVFALWLPQIWKQGLEI